MRLPAILIILPLFVLNLDFLSSQTFRDTSSIKIDSHNYVYLVGLDSSAIDTFTFEYPVVTGNVKIPILKRVNDFIKDSIYEGFRPVIEGYQQIEYVTDFPASNILYLTISWHYRAAYDSYGVQRYNFNLRNGELLKISDIIISEKLDSFIHMLNNKLDTIIEEHIAELENEYSNDKEIIKSYGNVRNLFNSNFSVREIQVSNLENIGFSIEADGILFFVSYNVTTSMRYLGFSSEAYLIEIPVTLNELKPYLLSEVLNIE